MTDLNADLDRSPIPDEAVDAAFPIMWPRAIRERCDDSGVRAVLAAAYPAIRKAVLEEAADRLRERWQEALIGHASLLEHNEGYTGAIDDLREMAGLND